MFCHKGAVVLHTLEFPDHSSAVLPTSVWMDVISSVLFDQWLSGLSYKLAMLQYKTTTIKTVFIWALHFSVLTKTICWFCF